MPITELRVKDENFGDKVFTGTAQSIYEEMVALKPELFENVTVDPDSDDTSLEARGLEKRRSVGYPS